MLALTPSERLWIDAMPRAAMRLFTTVLLFSAKETLFKALYPGVRTCL
ncbi:MAG: 4'-phosphopantetheinyl transferase superfamily protein [Aestuariivirga sp.]